MSCYVSSSPHSSTFIAVATCLQRSSMTEMVSFFVLWTVKGLITDQSPTVDAPWQISICGSIGEASFLEVWCMSYVDSSHFG